MTWISLRIVQKFVSYPYCVAGARTIAFNVVWSIAAIFLGRPDTALRIKPSAPPANL
jgi:hypothetical protein